MNPYNTFNKLGRVRSLDAQLIKADGYACALHVKPESSAFEALNSDYQSAVNIRVWSCDASELVDLVGVSLRPEAGDVCALRLTTGLSKIIPLRAMRRRRVIGIGFTTASDIVLSFIHDLTARFMSHPTTGATHDQLGASFGDRSCGAFRGSRRFF